MKSRYKLTLLISFILIGIINSLFLSNVSGAFDDDLDYNIIRNTPYDNINDLTNTTFNLRHSNTITQNYSATYNFLNDSIGSIPTNWTNSSTSGSTIQVISNLDKHNKVIEIFDAVVGQAGFYQEISDMSYGTIEYWMLTDDMTNGRPLFWIFHDGNELFRIYLRENLVRAYNGAFQNCGSASENQWTHIRIDFECTNGGYLGLAQYRFSVWNNEIEYGDFTFINNEPHIDKTEFLADGGSNDYTYVDAVGYYPYDINYTIGQNIIPDIINISSNILKPNRFEFNSNNLGIEHLTNELNPNLVGFENVRGSVKVRIDNDDIVGLPLWNYGVIIYSDQDNCGIKNDTLNIYDDMINITFGLRFTLTSAPTSNFSIYINSIDNTRIIDLQFLTQNTNKTKLQYYDGAIYQEIVDIFGIITPTSFYEFNLYIDDFSVNLRYSVNNTFNSSYNFPLIVNKKGINSLELYSYDFGAGALYVRVDYVGLYQYNVSLAYEYGYRSYNLDNNTWNMDYQNLFSLLSTDYIKITVFEFPYLYADSIGTPLKKEIRAQNNIIYFENLYGTPYPDDIPTANLLLMTNISMYIQQNFTIEGIKITEGNNTYYPDYIFNNVDKDINYFYALNNRLYFTGYYDNYSSLEYIQCIIDIDNQITVNRSLNFHHYYNSIGKSNLVLNYSDDSFDLFDIAVYFKSENIFLNQEKVITQFIFTSTDNNNSGYTNKTTFGYIGSLSLNFITNYALLITTTNLINLMIPLIVILIPSLAILNKYGKTGFFVVFLLMSVMLVASGMIPNWLFFVISFSISYLLLSKKQRVDDL